jgi:hypothetical protein
MQLAPNAILKLWLGKAESIQMETILETEVAECCRKHRGHSCNFSASVCILKRRRKQHQREGLQTSIEGAVEQSLDSLAGLLLLDADKNSIEDKGCHFLASAGWNSLQTLGVRKGWLR